MTTLRATDLGKAYRIYRRPIDSLKELVFRRSYAELFWALRGVNFEVARGGSLGIVGDNGAGKSTLLKLLAGSSAPTEGRVERSGRVSSILSLGAGFHAELSGLENIRIGCAVLGLSPEETDALSPRIVEFSELGSFIERPVRTYSSGMYLRLGFSVATVTDPDLLVVDEHLSVGDQHFRHKCLRRIMDLRAAGCSLVLCSHDLHSVQEVCEQTLWMHEGRPSLIGPTEDVLKVYQDHVRERDGRPNDLAPVRPDAQIATEREPGANQILSLDLMGEVKEDCILSGQRLELQIVLRLEPERLREGIRLIVLITRNDGLWCFGVKSPEEGYRQLRELGDDRYAASFVIPALPLLSGQYSFTVALLDAKSPHAYDHRAGACAFTVRHEGGEMGVVQIPHEWVVR